MPDLPAWLISLPTCGSTNTWALDHLDALAHGACIHTACQTAGRGRPGSIWHAPPGVLTASFVLEADLAAHPFALVAGLAVAHAAEDLIPGLQVRLKWPNDCLVLDRKLSGVLCERSASHASRLVVGIGLNLAPEWELCPEALPLVNGDRWEPTSLAELGAEPSYLEVLVRLRRYLLEASGLVAANGWRRLLPELTRRDALLDRPLRLETAHGAVTGTGAGIDEHGRLLIRGAGGVTAVNSARRITLIASE